MIDELVPCLKDSISGTVKETVVYKVETKNLLKDFNEKNGWYINWKEIPQGVDVYGFASNEYVLKHYIEKLNATYLGILHKFQFAILEKEAKKIKEVYDYEWD